MIIFVMVFKRQNSPGYLTNHLARLFGQQLHKRIEPLGIVPGQFPALLELFENDGQTQSELVAKLDVEQATLANTLARMERDGLILRKVDSSDGRVRKIYTTEKSRSIRLEAYNAAKETNEAVLSAFSKEERDVFVTLLLKAIACTKIIDD